MLSSSSIAIASFGVAKIVMVEADDAGEEPVPEPSEARRMCVAVGSSEPMRPGVEIKAARASAVGSDSSLRGGARSDGAPSPTSAMGGESASSAASRGRFGVVSLPVLLRRLCLRRSEPVRRPLPPSPAPSGVAPKVEPLIPPDASDALDGSSSFTRASLACNSGSVS